VCVSLSHLELAHHRLARRYPLRLYLLSRKSHLSVPDFLIQNLPELHVLRGEIEIVSTRTPLQWTRSDGQAFKPGRTATAPQSCHSRDPLVAPWPGAKADGFTHPRV
jgi:hypothetical protein